MSRRDGRIVASDPIGVRQLPDPKTSMARLTSPACSERCVNRGSTRSRHPSAGMATARGVKRRQSLPVKILGCQRPRPRRTVAATGLTACHPLVPSGKGAALTLVRKIDATSGKAFEDEDDDDRGALRQPLVSPYSFRHEVQDKRISYPRCCGTGLTGS